MKWKILLWAFVLFHVVRGLLWALEKWGLVMVGTIAGIAALIFILAFVVIRWGVPNA